MSISTYPCSICGRQFKTNQHLKQHKNKKKSCTMTISNPEQSEPVVLPVDPSPNDSTLDLKLSELLSFVRTAQNIQQLIEDKKLLDLYKNKIKELEFDNKNLREQLDKIKSVMQINHTTPPTIYNNSEIKVPYNLSPSMDDNVSKYCLI